MKKLLLIPALMVGALAMADQYKFELSPMIGYNFAEGNLNIKENGYPLVGLEMQANTADSKISPEFSILYSQGIDYKTGGETKITRGAFNGVYTFDATDTIVPFAKAGAGYEKIKEQINENESGFFLDAGAGLKVPFTDNLALKLEAIYMAKINSNNGGFADSNLATMAGLTYSFGAQEQKPAPVVEVVEIIEEVVIVVPVVIVPVVIVDGDDDNDGVLNSNDICPKTLAGAVINVDGCAIKKDLEINFENNSITLPSSANESLNDYADFLTTYTNYSTKIIGYTSNTGTEAYNQQLSEKRANSVKAGLTQRGVDAKQITTLGKGIADPIADNATAQGRAENRRIEAEVIKN